MKFKETNEKIPEDQVNDSLPDYTPEEEKTLIVEMKTRYCLKCELDTIMMIRPTTYTCTRCNTIFSIKVYEQMIRGYQTSPQNAKIIEDIMKRHRKRLGHFEEETDTDFQRYQKQARDWGSKKKDEDKGE